MGHSSHNLRNLRNRHSRHNRHNHHNRHNFATLRRELYQVVVLHVSCFLSFFSGEETPPRDAGPDIGVGSDTLATAYFVAERSGTRVRIAVMFAPSFGAVDTYPGNRVAEVDPWMGMMAPVFGHKDLTMLDILNVDTTA